MSSGPWDRESEIISSTPGVGVVGAFCPWVFAASSLRRRAAAFFFAFLLAVADRVSYLDEPLDMGEAGGEVTTIVMRLSGPVDDGACSDPLDSGTVVADLVMAVGFFIGSTSMIKSAIRLYVRCDARVNAVMDLLLQSTLYARQATS